MLQYCNERSVEIISKHPGIFIKQWAIGVGYFFLKPMRGYIDNFLGLNKQDYSVVSEKKWSGNLINNLKSKTSSLTQVLVVIQFCLLLLIVIAGSYGFIKSMRNIEVWLIVLLVFYFATTSSITEVDARFRIPVVPFLGVLASLGVYSWKKQI
jgi:hypothetical protein